MEPQVKLEMETEKAKGQLKSSIEDESKAKESPPVSPNLATKAVQSKTPSAEVCAHSFHCQMLYQAQNGEKKKPEITVALPIDIAAPKAVQEPNLSSSPSSFLSFSDSRYLFSISYF
jgi:hypothetical protein